MIKWLYQDGSKYGSGEGEKYPIPRQGYVWVCAIDPSEKQVEKISKSFKLPLSILRNYGKERRSVRYSFEPFACTFVDYGLEGNKIKRTNVLYFVSGNSIVTVLQGPVNSYEQIFKELSKKIAKERLSAIDVLIEILDSDIEENYDVMEKLEDDVTELEREVAERKMREIAKIVELRRQLNRMSRAFWGSSRVTYFLKYGLISLQPTKEQMIRLDDLHQSFIHQLDMVSNLKEMLTDILTIYQTNISNWLAVISNRINSSIRLLTWVMLVLTGLTLVITVPNTIATIFGIPYFGFSPSVSSHILELLIASTLIPALLFVFYWRVIKKKAEEVEKQNVQD